MHHKQVESWQVPSVLVKRASADGYGLRFSLSVSFYHAGSKRFYGDTFMGETLDEEDEERVEIVSEKRQGSSSGAKSGTRKVKETFGVLVLPLVLSKIRATDHFWFLQTLAHPAPVCPVKLRNEYSMSCSTSLAWVTDVLASKENFEPETPRAPRYSR